MIFTVHQAKTQLSKLIALAEAGEEVVIARKDKPAVRLQVLTAAEPSHRTPGAWKGRFELPDSFFDSLPEEELRAWEGD
jgi:antitoxin (DNA-binding transcriptional repressor) of toxin-antitoxin stability system